MRARYRSALLALVAVFALSAIAASAASAALPEFKPVPTKKKFTSTSGTVILKSSTTAITCSKGTTAGEITSASTVGKVIMKLTGCKVESGGCSAPLQTVGAEKGEIVTHALKGELGTVKKAEAASGAGLLLEAETAPTNKTIATFAKSECLPESVITGGVAGEVATVGKKQLTNALVFADPGNAQQIAEITLKGREVEPKLSGWGTTLTVSATDALTFEEALEVT